MCCFTGPVTSVKSTKIFARPQDTHRQFIVYQMEYKAKQELAMVLPLPTPKNSGEQALSFINLEDYPKFFDDVDSGFLRTFPAGLGDSSSSRSAGKQLEVIKVGSFEASFVPTIKDFSRLDARFRLPAGTWENDPVYKHYGFAVFKLRSDATTVHPLAFSFPRQHKQFLFFPTVHIHDGKVHKTAEFDHVLYCQGSDTQQPEILKWEESQGHAKDFVNISKSQGLVLPDRHCYCLSLFGRRVNRDTFIPIHS